MSDLTEGSTLPASLPSLEHKAIEALTDWTAMAQGAFATNTIRAWRADWESRGATVGDLRDVVNPLRCAVRASRKPGVTIHGHPSNACVRPLETAGKTSCFSRRGDHPPSLRSTRNKHKAHQAAVAGAIRNSTISGADPL